MRFLAVIFGKSDKERSDAVSKKEFNETVARYDRRLGELQEAVDAFKGKEDQPDGEGC